ncbi:MAG: radical SAM protein [Solobacterium sp.]|nr:radical SAM protein [Solobacterium sp.]
MHFKEAKTLLSKYNGMNICRGCTHGCIYCDSRSDCYQFSHDFEDVEVKANAPKLLEQTLRSRRNRVMISTGSMSDPYQPAEKDLKITRACLEVIEKYGFGASVITKSDLVLRDLDLFERINGKSKAVLQMTLTIADEDLSRKIEPGVCTSKRRYEVLKAFQEKGIPAVVWMTPLLPWLTDTWENVEQILAWCFDAGVRGIICFNAGLTLRSGNREYYYRNLGRMFPGLSEKYRKVYGNSYEVNSAHSAELMAYFHRECERHGVLHTPQECFSWIAEMPPRYEQVSLNL